eukprot:7306064-Lingulodinium_polyedra.AAC.1
MSILTIVGPWRPNPLMPSATSATISKDFLPGRPLLLTTHARTALLYLSFASNAVRHFSSPCRLK